MSWARVGRHQGSGTEHADGVSQAPGIPALARCCLLLLCLPGQVPVSALHQLGWIYYLLKGKRKSKRTINGSADTFSLYLFQPEEETASLHSFKNKAFKKARVCGVCKQIIEGRGISCRGESALILLMPIKLKQSKQTKTQNETFFREFPKLNHGIPHLNLSFPSPSLDWDETYLHRYMLMRNFSRKSKVSLVGEGQLCVAHDLFSFCSLVSVA